MPRTTITGITTPSFVVDPASINLNSGRQIDWENVAAGFANDAGVKVIPAGHRAYELESGKIVPEPVSLGGEPEEFDGTLIGVFATNAIEGDKSAALSGHGVIVGGVVYLELLPETLDATAQGELAAVGTGFAFETYSDSRAS